MAFIAYVFLAGIPDAMGSNPPLRSRGTPAPLVQL
jgi:hypothetical protein